MATSDAYGQRLGERMRVDNAPTIVTPVLRKTDMAATGIRTDHSLPEMSGSFQREDAFLVEWHFYTRMRALRTRLGYNPNNHQTFR